VGLNHSLEFVSSITRYWGQTNFFVVLLANVGIPSAKVRPILNFVRSIVSFSGAHTNVTLLDEIGHRPLMMFSTTFGAICLTVVSARQPKSRKQGDCLNWCRACLPVQRALLVGAHASSVVVSCRMLALSDGSQGYGYDNSDTEACLVSTVFNHRVCDFGRTFLRGFNIYAILVALERIGWKAYLVFVAWDIFETICRYFFAAETKQK
jgi:hypothetical protein